MIQKMPTYNPICAVCKQIAQTIPKVERIINSLKHQKATMRDADPIRLKEGQEGIQYLMDLDSKYLQGLKEAYKSILGVEYGSMQTHETPRSSMDEYVSCTLLRRGITDIEYEDIEPRNGVPYVRLYWKEHVIEDWRRKSKR